MLKSAFLFLLFMTLIPGCASLPVQNRTVPGGAIETLQGSVNVSISSPAGQMSGNGILFYRRPDSFRLSILAPFGQVILDILVEGERVLCLDQSRKTAWQGSMADLPPSLGTKVWPLLKWAVEPPHPAGPVLERIFTRADGTMEKVSYDPAGFVQRKANSAGDEVSYGDYRTAGGLAMPNRMEIHASEGSRLVLTFDDPDLNRPIEEGILNPKLDGYEMLPLAGFRGF